tara:strand:- start:110 stop:814 length:705 start_codon:yes stop_codon:yes gene_type:complete
MIKILTIIPARSGSKGIKNKNIKDFKGKPLLAYSIEQAKRSKYFSHMRIIVSTDSEKYALIAKNYGAEVPFLRPSNLSQDLSVDQDFIEYTLNNLKNYNADIILQLRPTHPCRKVEDIDKCLDIFIENRNKYDSLRAISPMEKSPFKMYTIDIKNNKLNPLFKEINGIKEPYNQCRQVLPQAYLHSGYIDIINTSILKNGTISGENVYPYLVNDEDIVDIDTEKDWKKAVELFS